MPNALIDIDWLEVALARLGNTSEAARRLHLNRETLYNWRDFGLAEVKFVNVVALANASHIPLAQLAERMGPFKPTLNTLSRNKRKTP